MRLNDCDHRMSEEICSSAFWRDAFVEYLATFLFLMAIIVLSVGWETGSEARLGASLGSGLVFVGLGWALADFGGAHMNPAVTFTLLVRRKITVLRAIIYWIVQIPAGITAAYTVKGLIPEEVTGPLNIGVTLVHPLIGPWRGMALELITTFTLCLTTHGSLNNKRKGNLFMPAIAMGLAFAGLSSLAWPMTGGSMNPARSFGPALASGVWDDHWVYWAGPMAGAFLAGFLYALINIPGHPLNDLTSSCTPTKPVYTNRPLDKRVSYVTVCHSPRPRNQIVIPASQAVVRPWL